MGVHISSSHHTRLGAPHLHQAEHHLCGGKLGGPLAALAGDVLNGLDSVVLRNLILLGLEQPDDLGRGSSRAVVGGKNVILRNRLALCAARQLIIA